MMQGKGAQPMLYKIARPTVDIAKWFWPAIIVAFLVTYGGNIAPLPRDSFLKTFSDSVFGGLFLPGLNLILTLSVLTLLIAITVIAIIITLLHKEDEEATSAAATTKSNTSVARGNRGATAQVQDSSSAIVFTGNVNAPVTITQPPPPQPTSFPADSHREVLQHYLNDIISKHTNLIPTGIANPASQSLLSVSVPLDEVFISNPSK
jgi:hypothetical protein